MLCHWHVSPPIPRRHTYLARQFVEPEDGATVVAAGDEEKSPSGSPLGERLIGGYDSDDKFFGLAF